MAGLKGQIRVPVENARIRRNSQNLANRAPFASGSDGISINSEGELVLNIGTDEPFGQSGGLSLTLATDPGLSAAGGELTAVVSAPITLDSNGIGFDFGAVRFPTRSVSSTGNVLSDDYYLFADASGGTITLTLPAPTDAGREVIIKRVDSADANLVTVDSASGNIDGESSIDLAPDDGLRFVSDGSNWSIV